MNDFTIMAELTFALGDRMRVKGRHFQFELQDGVSLWVERRFPAGFKNCVHIREASVPRFPNGDLLYDYLIWEGIPLRERTTWREYCIPPEHVREIIGINSGRH